MGYDDDEDDDDDDAHMDMYWPELDDDDDDDAHKHWPKTLTELSSSLSSSQV